MNIFDFDAIAKDFLSSCELNTLTEKNALSEELIGINLVEQPLIGFSSSLDPIYSEFQKVEIIGGRHRLPTDFLPTAKTVISFFLPFTKEVREDNAADLKNPSLAWLHARVEGQKTIFLLCEHVRDVLVKAGFKSVVPSISKDFAAYVSDKKPNSAFEGFGSNWSERHAAYASGLGTFGLSKGLITEKGTAGRLGSVITELEIEPTKRKYDGVYDYCSNCGACIKNCPVGAISFESGKINKPCADYVDYTEELHPPYYGCGKCQVKVPCEYKRAK